MKIASPSIAGENAVGNWRNEDSFPPPPPLLLAPSVSYVKRSQSPDSRDLLSAISRKFFPPEHPNKSRTIGELQRQPASLAVGRAASLVNIRRSFRRCVPQWAAAPFKSGLMRFLMQPRCCKARSARNLPPHGMRAAEYAAGCSRTRHIHRRVLTRFAPPPTAASEDSGAGRGSIFRKISGQADNFICLGEPAIKLEL